jgi:hypothetical protein
MRELSKVEKEIVSKIVNDGNTLTKLLGGISQELVISVDSKNKKVIVLVKNHKGGELVNKSGLQDFFIKRLYFISTLIHLLEYLEKDGYISTHLLSNINTDTSNIGDKSLVEDLKKEETNTIEYEIPDSYLVDNLIKYALRIIISTEALKQFVKNGFKTEDQIQYRKNYNIAVFAIILSFFLGIASIWISICSMNKPTMVESKQMEQITHRLDSLLFCAKSYRYIDMKPKEQLPDSIETKKIIHLKSNK